MCGIAGAINTNIVPIWEQQQHRGHDDAFIGKWNAVHLAHNRLAIIDLSPEGKQPIQTDRYVLTYNGEIYNYQPGHGNDAKWLLHKIEKDGLEAALSQSIGMFAFGLYDKLENKIHLVLDRMGEKPLYYYHEGDVFAFASSPAALLHLQDKWKINEQALQSYWKLGAVMYDSIWQGIKRVNAAQHVTYDINSNTITSGHYWQPEFQINTSGIEDLVLDAINKVKVADVPVYIFLSGGIDSSLVASQFSGGHAIHMDSPEYSYAQQVAARFNITLHKVSPKDFDPATVLMDYSSKSGEPTMAGMIPWITSAEASKLCKVAVSANGADELFFGYDRTSNAITDKQLKHIFRELPGGIPFYDIDERLSQGRWLELQTYVQHDLNRTLDFASMCHSLEVRSPFLDYRLVEMALSIPKKEMGRKDILKRMLRSFGFDDLFLNRPKMGFSLYVKPANLGALQQQALKFCIGNGYLQLPGKINRRDEMYLEAAALGFYYWWETFKDKIA